MITVTVLIGNSDDKLTQQGWSEYWKRVDDAVRAWANTIHFVGYTDSVSHYQTACWVIELNRNGQAGLMGLLASAKGEYGQDSIAVVVGETLFA